MKYLLSRFFLKSTEIDKLNETYAKIKLLQKWLNQNFPEGLPFEKPDLFKFTTAEDFLVEEAKRWKDYKSQK